MSPVVCPSGIWTVVAPGAPILTQSVAFLDCAVRDRMVVGEHTFFAGEVLEAGFLKDEDTDVLRMEDTRMNYGG